MNDHADKPFLRILKDKQSSGHKVPWWMMRQAGRYLPEYRELRAEAGSFLDLVYNPDFACEVTMQPIRRYGMDAAILFSDILVIPHALGQKLEFVSGEGPQLDPVRDHAGLKNLNAAGFQETLAPIYRSVANIRAQLDREGYTSKALIGFAGSPWTVACYMVEGGGSKDFMQTKRWAYSDDEGFAELIDLLIEATTGYLLGQIEAGAEAIQLFDSWAGVLDRGAFRDFVIAPTRRIVKNIRAEYPDIPIIGFPRGAGANYLDFVQATGVDGVSIDPSVPARWAARMLQPHCVVQGNLDPVHLLAGGQAMEMAMEDILENLKEGPFIFNLGHGVHKDTDPIIIDKLKNLLYG